MSMIEFQVNVSTFLAAQRTALRSRRLCPPRPMAVGQTEIIVDRIEFGNSAIRHNVLADFAILHNSLTSNAPGVDVEGYQTQIAQDVTVHVTTRDEILSRPNQPPANALALHGTIVFGLDFYAVDHDCFLRTEFARFEPGPLPSLPPAWSVDLGQLLTSVQRVLRSLIPTASVPAGLSELAALWANFINAGVSVDGGLQRIAFRAQIGGDHDGVVPRWRNFLRGHFSDRLGGAQWAFFVDSGLLTEMVKAKVNQELADLDVDELQLFVGCNYSHPGGKAVFTLDVKAIYDLPGPLPAISRNPRLPMEISVSAPNTLRLRADYSDVIGVIHSIDIIELILPSLSKAIEGLVQREIGSTLADVNAGNDAPYCKQMPGNIVECIKIVQLPKISSGTVATLTSVLALDDGISFLGTASSLSLSLAVLTTSFGKFTWTPPTVSCGQSSPTTVQDVRLNAAARSQLRAEVRLEHTGTTPVFVCAGPTVLKDDLGIFPASAIRLNRTRLPATIAITIGDPGLAYAAAPYDLDLMVSTTAGTRLIRLPPPPALTPEIVDFLADSVEVQLLICDKVLGPWFDGVRTFDVAWIENPLLDPPREITFEHLWQIEINGLREGQSVSLANAVNEPIMRAVAHDGVAVRLSALVPPAMGRDLTVALDGGRNAPSGDEDRVASQLGSSEPGPFVESALSSVSARPKRDGRGIEIRQQPSLHASSITLDSPCSHLLLSPLHEHSGIVAVLRDEIVVFDLRDPHSPIRQRSWPVEGVHGACRWQGSLLAFGEGGFAAITGEASPVQVGPQCESDLVIDMSVAKNVAYVLTPETLEVRSMRLCTMTTLPFASGRCLARMGHRLIVGGRAGLALYDTSDDRRPVLVVSHGELDVTGFVLPPDGPSGSVVATLADGSARMFSVRSGRLDEMAVYAQRPWFAESLRLGSLLIRVASDRRLLTVGMLGESRLVVPVEEPSGQAGALY